MSPETQAKLIAGLRRMSLDPKVSKEGREKAAVQMRNQRILAARAAQNSKTAPK